MLYSHNVALNIRSCREALGYSQDYMAEMLGICQSSYANLELGKTSLSLDRLLRIAEILGTDVHKLISIVERENNEKIGSKNNDASNCNSNTIHVYDQLITELKSEISFLRHLVLEKQR